MSGCAHGAGFGSRRVPLAGWLGWLLVGVALVSPPRAHACSTVKSYIAGPAPDAEIPGNLVFFQVQDQDDGVQFAIVDAESGAPIATHIESVAAERVLKPDLDIPPGRRLALVTTLPDLSVSAGSPAPRVELSRVVFTTTDPVELDPQPPRLEVVKDDGDVVIRYVPPLTGAASHLLQVAGRVADGWLPLDSSGPVYTYRIGSACDGIVTANSCGYMSGLPEGSYEVVVTAHIVGSSTQPEPLRQTIEISCAEGCRVTANTSSGGAAQGLGLLLLAWALGRLRAARA